MEPVTTYVFQIGQVASGENAIYAEKKPPRQEQHRNTRNECCWEGGGLLGKEKALE